MIGGQSAAITEITIFGLVAANERPRNDQR